MIIMPLYEPMSPSNILTIPFLRFMEADSLLVQTRKSANPLPIGNCYWNVDRAVNESGGSAVYGWLVYIWPNSHIEAMHHAIWKNKDGQLVDITQGYYETEPVSTFLIDNRIPIDLQKMPNIPSRFFQISENSLTLDFINAIQESHSLERKKSDFLYEAGYRCEAQFDLAFKKQADKLPELSESEMLALFDIAQGLKTSRVKIGSAIIALKEANLA